MCILLRLHYAKYDASRLFHSNVTKKNLGGSARSPSPPSLGKGRVNQIGIQSTSSIFITCTFSKQILFLAGKCSHSSFLENSLLNDTLMSRSNVQMKMKNLYRNLIFIEIMLKGLGLMLIVLLQMAFESLAKGNLKKARKDIVKRTLAEKCKLVFGKNKFWKSSSSHKIHELKERESQMKRKRI